MANAMPDSVEFARSVTAESATGGRPYPKVPPPTLARCADVMSRLRLRSPTVSHGSRCSDQHDDGERDYTDPEPDNHRPINARGDRWSVGRIEGDTPPPEGARACGCEDY